MKKESERKIELTNLTCHRCGDTIRNGKPYVRNGKLYCHICEGRARIGLFDGIIPQEYKGVRIGG